LGSERPPRLFEEQAMNLLFIVRQINFTDQKGSNCGNLRYRDL
jgi:hypothetical protein